MIFNDLFSEYLLDNEYLEKFDLQEILEISNLNATPINLEIIKRQVLSEEEITRALADFLNMNYRNYAVNEIDMKLVQRYSREKLIELQAIPYNETPEFVNVAVANPFRRDEIDVLKFDYNKPIKCFLITPGAANALLEYIDNRAQQLTVLSEYATQNIDYTVQDDDKVTVDAPVIKLCDAILKDAISRGASDIHIEPFEEIVKVRLRIDGKLILTDSIPNSLYQAVLARFKIMSGMNIAERRVPQDGKINLEVKDVNYDFRVSTIPTINGEKIVIRIYNVSFKSGDLDALGFNESQKDLVYRMITRPHGIILLTGPTGSGKSTSMYTFLRYLNKDDTNIITVEDPVENQIEGINQVQVNPKANLTFATALRSILRQDPNVVMIGEIRDEETAEIATRAAITGHLVLSTIHTNDVAGVVTRLINMGIPRYLVADALLGAISQRLVRKLCPDCKKKHLTTDAETHVLGLPEKQYIYEPCGCRRCNNTGYIGRVGVFEIMVLNDEIRNLIMSEDFNTERLNELLSKTMSPILENTRERVLDGTTSFEEYEQLSDVVKVERKEAKEEANKKPQEEATEEE